MPEPRRTRRRLLPRKDRGEEQGESPVKPLAELLKEQLLLLSSLVLIVGVASTDSYYGTFSFGYQFLDLPANHLIFRGVTMLATSPWLFALYAIAILWLLVDDRLVATTSYTRWRSATSYVIILALLGLAFPLARYAGRVAAIRDLGPQSRLPRLARLQTKDEQLDLQRGYRLLLSNTHFVVVFQPLKSPANGAELPKIRQFPLESVQALETLPNAVN
jgi:hypothetical protein